MTLVDIYKTNQRLLLNIVDNDFEDTQWQDLAIHLGNHYISYHTDEYDPDVIRHILPIIGNRVLWQTITSAQQFLYTAIFQNDAQTVDFILNTFENVRNDEGRIEGWEGYVETAVEQKLQHSNWSYDVLDRLLQNFDNTKGHGLLRCVQKNNLDVLRYIFPHSDPARNYFFAYRWAQVYELKDIEHFLQPHTNMLHALFGYYIEQWVEPEDREKAKTAATVLQTEILNGLYDHQPLALAYRMGMENGCLGDLNLTHVSNNDRARLVLLWSATQLPLALDVLETLEYFEHDVAHEVVENFRNHPEIVIPRLSSEQRQDELYNCAHHPEHYTFAQQLVKYGADPHKTLLDLNETTFSGFGLTKYEDERKKAVETLEEWISQWQAQSIQNTLGPVGGEHKPSKI